MRRLLCLLSLLLMTACANSQAPAPAPAAEASDIPALSTIDRIVGTGAVAQAGQQVTVQYTGWLYDAKAKDHHGAKFDSSYDSGQPFSFALGAGDVIQGWDKGVAGMHVGGKRTLLIPSAMGYGANGAGGGDIPPNAALVFDVELLGVK
jgi:FKBP-type peptidyl-prolyl cis-trans isomerase FkpA